MSDEPERKLNKLWPDIKGMSFKIDQWNCGCKIMIQKCNK